MSGVDLRRAPILRSNNRPLAPSNTYPPLPYKRKPALAPATIIPTLDQHNNVGPVSALGRLPHHQISRLVMLQHVTGRNLLTSLTSSGHLLILTTCCTEFTQRRQFIYLVRLNEHPRYSSRCPSPGLISKALPDTVRQLTKKKKNRTRWLYTIAYCVRRLLLKATASAKRRRLLYAGHKMPPHSYVGKTVIYAAAPAAAGEGSTIETFVLFFPVGRMEGGELISDSTIAQRNDEWINQPMNQAIDQFVNPRASLPTKSTSQSANQPIGEPINQSINQPTNQSTDQ